MKNPLNNRHQTLKSKISKTYLTSTAMAFLVFLVMVIGITSYKHGLEKSETEKVLKAKFGSVRNPVYKHFIISSEPTEKGLEEIKKENEKSLGISKILITKSNACPLDNLKACYPEISGYAIYADEIGIDNYLLILAQEMPQFDFKLYLLFCILTMLVLVVPYFFQMRNFKNLFFGPFYELIQAIKDKKSVDNSSWPSEMIEIYREIEDTTILKAEAISESRRGEEFYKFANQLLHDIKNPLIVVLDKIKHNNAIPEIDREAIISIIDRPRVWIESALKEYKKNSLGTETASSKITTIGTLEEIRSEYGFLSEESGNFIIEESLKFRLCALSAHELLRCIQNLVSNANDAIAGVEGGEITVRVQHQKDDENGEYCEINVMDNGIPFPDKVLESLKNEKYFTTKGDNGSGIGLVTVYNLIKKIGGSFVPIDTGDGKIIRITIPLISPPKWVYDINKLKSNNFIILDDDSTIRSRLIKALKIEDSDSIKHFFKEKDFLEESENTPDSVLIVDYNFNGSMNGLDFIIQNKLEERAVLLSNLSLSNLEPLTHGTEHNVKVYSKEYLYV